MKHILATAGWAAFVAFIVLGGRMMLDACEMRPWPVFGYAFCPRPPQHDTAGLAAERERARTLQSRLRNAEQRFASLPDCQPPKPVEAAAPPEPPKSEPPKHEEMKFPTSLADLKGCWRSDRGDIDIVTDDERRRHIGVVRICYCFDDSGHGVIRQKFKDGDHCRGRLRVQLSHDRLKIDHRSLPCSGSKRNHVPERIDCHGTAGQAATCSSYQLGRMRGPAADERFHKVESEACEWNN